MVGADGILLSNQTLTFRGDGSSGWWGSAFSLSAPQKSVNVWYKNADVMPRRLRLGLDPVKGTITLFDDRKVYAFLVKDNATTLFAIRRYLAETVAPSPGC
jgi:hypothetical protein